jgi:hypothetical protein
VPAVVANNLLVLELLGVVEWKQVLGHFVSLPVKRKLGQAFRPLRRAFEAGCAPSPQRQIRGSM